MSEGDMGRLVRQIQAIGANLSALEKLVRLMADMDWHRVGDGAFASPFGTIRVCRACGCLVAGGPTACGRCVEKQGAKRERQERSVDQLQG